MEAVYDLWKVRQAQNPPHLLLAAHSTSCGVELIVRW